MKMFTLNNGLRVVVVEMNHLHTAEVGLYIKVGAINDPKDKGGLSHFTEHMVFRGTELCPSEFMIDVEFEKVGGMANASTDEEITCYHSNCHPSEIGRTIELISAIAMKPLFQDFNVEKQIILQEVYEYMNNKRGYVGGDEVVGKLMWGDHPYGNPVLGTLKSVRNMKLNDIKEHVYNYYSPTNSVLVITGNVNVLPVMNHVENYFGKWTGPVNNFKVEECDLKQTETRFKFTCNDTAQYQIYMGFRGCYMGFQRMEQYHFLSFIMNQCSSGIHSRLRTKEGIVYELNSFCNLFLLAGALNISLSTDAKKLEKAISRSFEELGNIVCNGISAEDLERFKRAYLFKIDFSKDCPSTANIRYGSGIILDCLRTEDEDRRIVQEMNSDDIRTIAGEIFRPENLNLALIGPYSRKSINMVKNLLSHYKNEF